MGSAAVVSTLLYWEQAALIYVLSTLLVCALLLIIAFSDLKGGDRELKSSASGDDVAAGFDAATTAPSPAMKGASQGEGRKPEATRQPES